MDKAIAMKLLIEDRFSLLTPAVQDALEEIRAGRPGPFANRLDATDLWRRFPEHFDLYFYEATYKDTAKRKVIETACDGSEFTEAHRALLQKLLRSMNDFRSLTASDDSQFMHLYKEYKQKASKRFNDAALRNDFVAFYSFPEAEADFDWWLQLEVWSIEEANALSFGKSPDVVDETRIAEAAANSPTLFLIKYKERKTLIERAVEGSKLSLPLKPEKFLLWCLERKIDIPSRLEDFVVHERDFLKSNEAELNTLKKRLYDLEKTIDDMNPRNRRTLHLLILGLAVEMFSHEFGKKSSSTAMIQTRLLNAGIKMDVGTIKAVLDNAAADESLEAEVAKLKVVVSKRV